MKKFLEMLTEEMQQAFTAAGYDGSLGKVMLSNRPDLCEYQCNGAMAGAKLYKRAVKRQQGIFRSGGSSPRIPEPEGQ